MTLTDECLTYHEQAAANSDAQLFFKSRGLEQATVDRFKLGWITDPQSLEARKYVGSPVIPYMTLTGKVILAKVKTNWPKPKPKYMPLGRDYPLAEPRRHLFNAMQAMPSMNRRDVYLVEGEFDAMIAVQCGVKAVSVPGVDGFYEPWVHLFEEAAVHLVFDGDDAGRAGANKLSSLFRRHRVDVDVIELPSGMDLTDIFLASGRDGVRSVLNLPS